MLKEMITNQQSVQVYGKSEFELPREANLSTADIQGLPPGQLHLVAVFGVKVAGICIKYPQPRFLLLPGPGLLPIDCGWGSIDDIKMWTLPNTASVVEMTPNVLTKAAILGEAQFVSAFPECLYVTIQDGQACLKVPIFGKICVDVPDWVPNGTVAEACIDVCKVYDRLCGVKVHITVAGNKVAEEKLGCC